MRRLTKIRLAKFFSDKKSSQELLEELARGTPLQGALLSRRLPLNVGESLLRIQLGDDLERALRKGKESMQKADEKLSEWARCNQQRVASLPQK